MHLEETWIVWGGLKPKPENMSEYCKTSATKTFENLVLSLKCKYIVVSYNNTYNSKSSSSQNKITLYNMKSILEKEEKFGIWKPYQFFSAGKNIIR